MMDGQVTHVMRFQSVSPQHDAHGLAAITHHYAEALVEKTGSVEVRVESEFRLLEFHILYAVEREDSKLVLVFLLPIFG